VHGPNRHCKIFGEVFRALDILDKIVAAASDQADNPHSLCQEPTNTA
jgi:hypothetical protein